MLKQDKKAPIFQNLFNRPEFLLTNLFLHIFFRRKIILFIHEVYEIDHLNVIKKLYHSLINYISFLSSSLIVTNSRFTADWVCRFGNFENKIFVMYPVMDLRTDNAERLKESRNNSANILCVGNIRRNKGQIYLLQAMKYIKYNFKIVFAGLIKENDYMEQLKEYCVKNSMSDKVGFTGYVDKKKLSEEYKKADIFVLPTLKEGFGMTVLEAMSYGLPVVVSNIGAVSEIIENRVNGLLIEPEKPESLSKAINEILEKPSFRKKLQKNAIKRAAQFKTIEEQFGQLYKRVVDAIT